MSVLPLELRGWLRRRAPALAAAALTAGALLWSSSGATWLHAVGALAVAHALFRLCALWRVGSSWWASGRVSRVERRAVLVTGCDTGFGHVTALRLHAAGVGRVFACVLDDASAGAEALRSLRSPRLKVLPCDVTDDGAIAEAAGVVRRELEASGCELWAVVNNAGVVAVGEAEWMSLKDLQKVLNVNTLGQVRVTQTFLPLIRKTQGRIVNVNSVASQLCGAALTPYTMSKYASGCFTKSLRVEISRFNVSVHSIEPWIVKTNMAKGFIPTMENILNGLPSDLKKDYSEEYREKILMFAKLVYKFTASPESKIEDVVDAIEDACLSKYPEDRYVLGTFGRIVDPVVEHVHSIQYWVLKYFTK